MKISSSYLILLSVFSILLGCAETEIIDENSAEGAFSRAERMAKNERFEEAIAYYKQVKNKHPYSRFAISSELRIADINYDRERYIEAENDYRLFKEFHPKHAKVDYVTYRLGMTYFKQLPDTIDRDLTLANKAILYFDEVIQSYPSSKFVTEAKKYKNESLKMLAGKEEYIANFYFIRKKYDSALGRYTQLLEKYPNLGFNKKALYGATISAYRDENFPAARKYFQKLASTFPNSEEKAKAEKELSHGAK